MKKAFVGWMAAFVAATAVAKPAIYWFSDPVKPGDAVLVSGEGFATNGELRVTAGGREAKVLSVSHDALTFELPEKCSGIKPIVCEIGGTVLTLNAPTVWWTLGDRGGTATRGGWVRLFGKNLQRVRAKRYGMRGFSCVTQDCWSATFRVPDDAELGRRAGAPDCPALPEIVSAEPFWKTNVFDVTAFGAVAGDTRDDTRAVLAALAAIQKSGGGILYFPAGIYGMSGTIELPPHSLLSGAGEDRTMIQWGDRDHPDPREPFVALTHHCGISRVFLASGNFENAVVTRPPRPGEAWVNESIALDHVRGRFIHTDVTKAEGIRRLDPRQDDHWEWDRNIFHLRARNVTMTDCDFGATKGIAHVDVVNGVIRGNRFRCPDCCFYWGDQLLIEGNDNSGCSASYRVGNRNGLLAGNRFGGYFGRPYGQTDRETLTFDLGAFCYRGSARAEGVRLQLAIGGNGGPGGHGFGGFGEKGSVGAPWLGRFVRILSGTGAGQWRKITAVTGKDELTVDRPWEVVPAADSVFAIWQDAYRVVAADNDIADGNSMTSYGNALEVIFSGNHCRRNAGILGSAGYQWGVQLLDNVIEEGGAVREASYNDHVAATVGFFGNGGPSGEAPCRFVVVRGNHLKCNAAIRLFSREGVRQAVVDRNTVENNPFGIQLPDGAAGITLHRNRFRNVARPYAIKDDAGLVTDISGPAACDLAHYFGMDRLSADTFGLSTGWQTSQTFAIGCKVWPAWMPMGKLALASANPPPGVSVQFDPGKGVLTVMRAGTNETTFSFPMVWELTSGTNDVRFTCTFEANRFLLRGWLVSTNHPLAGDDVRLCTNLLGMADEKLTAAEEKPHCTAKVDSPKGTVVYGRTKLLASRPIFVKARLSWSVTSRQHRALYVNGRLVTSMQNTSTAGCHTTPEFQLRAGENVIEFMEVNDAGGPMDFWVMLEAAEPTSPGDLAL